ncbi:MAG: hypothetical protein ACRD6W_03555 [Nitrososphaerales archaeon]
MVDEEVVEEEEEEEVADDGNGAVLAGVGGCLAPPANAGLFRETGGALEAKMAGGARVKFDEAVCVCEEDGLRRGVSAAEEDNVDGDGE